MRLCQVLQGVVARLCPEGMHTSNCRVSQWTSKLTPTVTLGLHHAVCDTTRLAQHRPCSHAAPKYMWESLYLSQAPVDHGVCDNQVQGIAQEHAVGDDVRSQPAHNFFKAATAEVEQHI